jgi:hypothetical protein
VVFVQKFGPEMVDLYHKKCWKIDQPRLDFLASNIYGGFSPLKKKNGDFPYVK